MAERYVTTGALDFLQDLDLNNERVWFKAHQDDYERLVREPLLRFIRDVEEPVHKRISRRLVCDDRKVGGSLFRIHRDTRFAKDKTPYKTNSGIALHHEGGREHPAPVLYLNIEPGNCFIGVGCYRPPSDALRALREAMVAKPATWVKARDAVTAQGWDQHGDQLTRAPRGFDPDHPLIDDLRRTSHAFVRRLSEREVTARTFPETFVSRCEQTLPVLRWQAKALGVPF
jgi:uncharacterized protein (TIGR02453 family)